jgi:hypothetical protein
MLDDRSVDLVVREMKAVGDETSGHLWQEVPPEAQ